MLLWLAKRRPCSAAGVHLPTSFIRDVGFGVATAAKLQHIQLLCCLKMFQLKFLYSHVIFSTFNISKSQVLQPTRTPIKRASTYPSTMPLYTPQRGLYTPLERACIYPSKGPLHTPHKVLYIRLERGCTYPAKGPLYTPQRACTYL